MPYSRVALENVFLVEEKAEVSRENPIQWNCLNHILGIA